jgi:hypothetical protein
MAIAMETGYDVVVAGGGTSGAVAAIAAARQGARTLLIERYGYVGGMAGTGMFMFGVNDGGGAPAVRGILQELFDRMAETAGARAHFFDPMFGAISPLDGEMVRNVLVDLLLESGVQLRLHTMVVDSLVERNTVRGVVVQSKSGQLIIPAKVVIDATADADVAARADAELDFGRPEDRRTQPASLVFRVNNADIEATMDYLRSHPHEIKAPPGFSGDDYSVEFLDRNPAILLDTFPSLVRQAREDGAWDLARNRVSLYIIRGRNEVVVNSTRVSDIDGTSVEDLTAAEIELLRQANTTVAFLRAYVPGFASAYLSGVPHAAGIRETRRIRGLYQLTAQDVLAGASFDDGIARGAYPLDIHDPAPGTTVMGAEVEGGHTTLIRIDRSFGVPYRCLVPVRLDGLLVAGRAISASHEAAGAIRGMSVCMATGEAAGTAAGLCVREDVAPRELDAGALRAVLRGSGAVLDGVEAPAGSGGR